MTSADSEDFCHGLRLLLVEDETMVAMLTEALLNDMGCEQIVIASTAEQALALMNKALPDVAVLDVNLGDHTVFPVADKLTAEGVPFVFATGYGDTKMLAPWRHSPIVQKPFFRETLEEALRTVLGALPA